MSTRKPRPVKVGASVRLKNGDYLAEFGTVVLVIGEGSTATHQIRTAAGYVWCFRDEFTLAK